MPDNKEYFINRVSIAKDGTIYLVDYYNQIFRSVNRMDVGETSTQKTLEVFPLLASDLITIKNIHLGINKLEIFNLQGIPLIAKEIDTESDPVNINVDLTCITSGIYIMVTTDNSGEKTAKYINVVK